MTSEITDDRTEEAIIERDIERTQDEMGETVQKLEESLNPREVARSVIADQNSDLAREVLEVVRQNPIPAAMIAVGAIWLLATARTPSGRRLTDRLWSGSSSPNLRPRSEEPAPIGPPPGTDPSLDRRPSGSSVGGPF